LSLSPSGDRLAFAIEQNGRVELWVKELDTGPAARLAAVGRVAYRPAWTPDGRSVLFVSDATGYPTIFSVPADGSAAPEVFLESQRSVDEASVSADGMWLIYRQGSGGSREVFARRLDGDTSAIDLMDSDAEEFAPALSPDGRWLAYASTESGSDEVYVRPFPDARTARWQVSRDGGGAPLWSHSGRELFYRNRSNELVAVAIADGPNFRVMSEQILFSTSDYLGDIRHRAYAASADGQSFVFARRPSDAVPRLVIVLNWFEELKRLVPGG
jgi:serine/threonine-protein kinase